VIGIFHQHAMNPLAKIEATFPQKRGQPDLSRTTHTSVDRQMESKLITHPTVLVIEDDVQLQMAIEAALEYEGLQLAIAASGEEAITLMQCDGSEYGALVTDIRLLGRIDGWHTARAARRINPTIPVVYITGEAAIGWETQGVPNSVLLKKPFLLADLATLVLQLLKGSGPESYKHVSGE
jgi:CheY-like chemotaxis protein